MTGINNAIRKHGNANTLGKALGVSRMAVCLWKKNGVPPDRVLSIFQVTGVTPHELRPDLYPNPTDGLPPGQQDSTGSA
ncbi:MULTISPECIES: YdaS family helix-turn-helix protein [unclassified Serratia (in: enterobacteria)]|uniref:transcriptional regulator n=1 Tax=unclassified Serratia (in: enterobacteria) TaxID=2647522 RepID=UPI0005007237|nr:MULTISPECIES: YdaS family helix-turn-helix protein [unclassified Serratia (in: enterobacteria)]KFK94562.1 Rha family transcriptional regulator [Serratia sp. Ag2]KFK95782.1 Rha family transcriptional regulator [Serratia sp. Ag1]